MDGLIPSPSISKRHHYIEIGEITGGFGSVTAEVKNTGAGEASNVAWSITLKGGLILLGRETNGTITKIQPGFSPQIQTGFLLGIGTITITVTADDSGKNRISVPSWTIRHHKKIILC